MMLAAFWKNHFGYCMENGPGRAEMEAGRPKAVSCAGKKYYSWTRMIAMKMGKHKESR